MEKTETTRREMLAAAGASGISLVLASNLFGDVKVIPDKDNPKEGRALIVVDDTQYDACAKVAGAIWFTGKTGKIEAPVDNTTGPVELPAIMNKLTWYCGGDDNDTPAKQAFNWVTCERKKNGAIHWIFYVGVRI